MLSGETERPNQFSDGRSPLKPTTWSYAKVADNRVQVIVLELQPRDE